VLARREYLTAPVSPLYYEGTQTRSRLRKGGGGEPEADATHVRLLARCWTRVTTGEAGFGSAAATYDRSVGLQPFAQDRSRINIGADVDAERDELTDDLARGGHVEATYRISGVGPTLMGRKRRRRPGILLMARLLSPGFGRAGVAADASPEALPAPVDDAVEGSGVCLVEGGGVGELSRRLAPCSRGR